MLLGFIGVGCKFTLYFFGLRIQIMCPVSILFWCLPYCRMLLKEISQKSCSPQSTKNGIFFTCNDEKRIDFVFYVLGIHCNSISSQDQICIRNSAWKAKDQYREWAMDGCSFCNKKSELNSTQTWTTWRYHAHTLSPALLSPL